MASDENALDAQEVATILQVSRNTVYNLVKSGELASYSVGRKMRFMMRDVEAYIATARNATSEPTASSASKASTPAARGNGEHVSFRIAGNDVSADIVANYLGASGLPIQRIYENSYHSLVDMYSDGIEAAMVHLYDHKTGEYNVPYVQRIVPGTSLVVIRIVKRRQGLLVKRGNPKGLRKWSDFLRDDVTMVNRERGAGSRILLDENLTLLEAGETRPIGYEREFTSPLALGAFVANGGADVGVGSERVYHQVDGLDFLPLQDEYLDLVLLKNKRTAPAVRFLRGVLASSGFRDELGNLVGYDAASTGRIIYEV